MASDKKYYGSLIGISALKVPEIKEVIQEYIKGINSVLDNLDDLKTEASFKGEYANAINNFVKEVKKSCYSVVGVLLTFNSKLELIKSAFESQDKKLKDAVAELKEQFKNKQDNASENRKTLWDAIREQVQDNRERIKARASQNNSSSSNNTQTINDNLSTQTQPKQTLFDAIKEQIEVNNVAVNKVSVSRNKVNNDDWKSYYSTNTSNQKQIYNYLSNNLGLNDAATAGVMANMYEESRFNPKTVGDHGNSHGLCQWNSAGGGYAYPGSTVDQQLDFLAKDLNKRSSIYENLKNTPDTADGAYQAAYMFCTQYERPTNKVSKGKSRGNGAINLYNSFYK